MIRCEQCGGYYENTMDDLEYHIYKSKEHDDYIKAVCRTYKRPWWKIW